MYREYLYIFYLVIIDTIYIYSKFKYLTLQCFCIKNLSRTISLKHLTKKKNLKNTRKKGAVFITLSYGAFNLTFLRLYPSELWRVYFDLFALTLQF